MSDITERILKDAKSRKPDYADRMEVFEPGLRGLPENIKHYAIDIRGLFSYVPISYIVVDNDEEFFTSLRKGDFSELMKRLEIFKNSTISPVQFAILYLLIDFPSRDLRIVENIDDLQLSSNVSPDIAYKVGALLSPAILDYSRDRLYATFFCYNRRLSCIEQFKVTMFPSFHFDAENTQLINMIV